MKGFEIWVERYRSISVFRGVNHTQLGEAIDKISRIQDATSIRLEIDDGKMIFVRGIEQKRVESYLSNPVTA